jgi:hypothetical protein
MAVKAVIEHGSAVNLAVKRPTEVRVAELVRVGVVEN